MSPVSPQELERLLREATDEGCRAYIEGGDPCMDKLIVNERPTHYAAKRVAA